MKSLAARHMTIIAAFFGLFNNAHAQEHFEFSELNVDKSEYGVPGDSPALIKFATNFKETPQKSKTGKTLLTFNKTGFDILSNADHVEKNWIIKDFLNQCGKGKVVLDIGGGFGALTKSALSKGTTVIYSDMSYQHLLVGYKTIEPKYHSHVFLNDQALPDITFPADSFDAIVAHRVLHFLTPAEIEKSTEKFYRWLKPNGKLYIVALSPTNAAYRDIVLPQYEARWEAGDRWPGYPLEVKQALPHQAYNLPETMHVMDERPLKRCLKEKGFFILKHDYVSTIKLGVEKNRDGKESIGILAQK